jgi:chromosome segregation protein
MTGFKSFAEPIVIEFGPGISAIIGPNGSGKSNLADALRWALGEQGRSLRTRRAEDVIFAGSQRRHATGMADVSLVLDNEDGLVPLEFGEVALGRRLFRSGENDYLVNRQRVRYRDLVDLLDSAGLADNAFLFIGQGMVDQALALRPEERRPLFEEVAGVRRHERRRRHAEAQLAEAEANLVRVHDLLGELRPQARRLAQQVEQEAARRVAAEELADAVVTVARARWTGARATRRAGAATLEAARAETRQALSDLRAAEDAATSLGTRLAEGAPHEAALRTELDATVARLAELRRSEARLDGTLDALDREARRLVSEREAVEARREQAHQVWMRPIPEVDLELTQSMESIERELTAAQGELERLRAESHAADQHLAALRRAEAARHAERELVKRRAVDARQRRDEQAARAAESRDRATMEGERRAATARGLAAAIELEEEAEGALSAARDAAETAEGRHAARAASAAATTAALSDLRARLEAMDARIETDGGRGMLAAARRRGGRRIAEGLDVEPGMRAAVETTLGAALRSAALPSARVAELRSERGVLVLADAQAPRTAERDAARAREAALSAGGGMLADAVRHDPTGTARRLLAGALWVPELEAALRLRGDLPSGWSVATPSGDLVTAAGVVALGGAEAILDHRAEREVLAIEVAERSRVAWRLDEEAAATEKDLREARAALDSAREAAEAARGRRRAAEEADRQAARTAETAQRTAAWDGAQLERLASEANRADEALGTLEPGPAVTDGLPDPSSSLEPAPDRNRSAVAAWEDRVASLTRRLEKLAPAARQQAQERRRAEDERGRSEARIGLDDERLQAIDAELARLAGDRDTRTIERTRLQSELASAAERERTLRATLEGLLALASADRAQLAASERAVSAARERLRGADERVRVAEVGDVEARLAEEAGREQLLIELAALGPVGLDALRRVVRGAHSERSRREGSAEPDGDEGRESAEVEMPVEPDDDLTAPLEAAMAMVEAAWDALPPPVDVPGPGRLASLRRRFHELGAPNPYAAAEQVEVRQRLETLERQREDLERAIHTTRQLVAELGKLIVEQFHATFIALEDAFARRFTQLFGGGVASLSLTDPDDLEATGVEIMAQPPEKKRQALAMLSGGERALTAVALLFAMLEVRPVPFCVLDEVDAALDEANIGRFAAALREFAARTQCIVITHNRGTIEAADALYGVTIGDDAISRVISLRLEDADDAIRQRRVAVGRSGRRAVPTS